MSKNNSAMREVKQLRNQGETQDPTNIPKYVSEGERAPNPPMAVPSARVEPGYVDQELVGKGDLPIAADSLDLEFYKDLYQKATKAQELVASLRQQVTEAERTFVSHNGALAAFSNYIQAKYQLSDADILDPETGVIKRNP